MKTKSKKLGRPKATDPCKPLPFRLRSSVIKKAKRLGRDGTEKAIEDAENDPSAGTGEAR